MSRGKWLSCWLGVLPALAGGADLELTEYAGALGQATYRGVAAAADEVAGLLEETEPSARCLFLVWALQVSPGTPFHDTNGAEGQCHLASQQH